MAVRCIRCVARRAGRGAGTVSDVIIRQGVVVVGEHDTAVADVLIDDGRIVEVATAIRDAPSDAFHEIDARDCWVGPGFVDLHVHLREPGREAAETICERAARAGVLGGYQRPGRDAQYRASALDNVALVSYVLERAAAARRSTSRSPAPSPSAAAASRWRRWPRWRLLEFVSSPTTGSGCRTRR